MLRSLQVTLGPATDSHATLFVRPPVEGFEPGWHLAGFVHGPRCQYARTLPTEFRLEDLGADPTPLAKVEVSEPCYWTPELPYLYELNVSLRDDFHEVESVTVLTGLKRFAIDRGRFWLDRKPHVLRAWRAPGVDDPESIRWNDFRQAHLSLWCDEPSDALLDAAAAYGVMVATDAEFEHPSPALTVLSRESVCFSDMPLNACLLGGEQAVVTRRHDARLADAATARAACEQLQRDCVPYTDLAGYVV